MPPEESSNAAPCTVRGCSRFRGPEVIKNIETIYERKIGRSTGTFVIWPYKSSFILSGLPKFFCRLKPKFGQWSGFELQSKGLVVVLESGPGKVFQHNSLI